MIKKIFQKFHSEIVEYLQRYSSFSVRNRTAEISLPFAKLSSFQSLSSRNQFKEIELQNGKHHLVRLVFWFWKKPLPWFDACPNWFILTIGKHPWSHFDFRKMETLKVNKFGRTYRTWKQAAQAIVVRSYYSCFNLYVNVQLVKCDTPSSTTT